MCWRGRTKSLSNGSTLLSSKDMKKQIAVLALCAVLFALYSSAQAQQPTKIFRIGFLDTSTASGMAVFAGYLGEEVLRVVGVLGKKKNIVIGVCAAKEGR